MSHKPNIIGTEVLGKPIVAQPPRETAPAGGVAALRTKHLVSAAAKDERFNCGAFRQLLSAGGK